MRACRDACRPDVSAAPLGVVEDVADAQAQFAARVEPHLTEEEMDVFRRGQNAHARHATPKNQDPYAYSRATALEALFGYLYLTGQNERILELFSIATQE